MQDRPSDGTAPSNHEIIFYSTPDGAVRVKIVFEGKTFWLAQKKMADLFGIGVQTINHHFQEIYKCKELRDIATVRKFRIVQSASRSRVSKMQSRCRGE